jgi:cytochrome b6
MKHWIREVTTALHLREPIESLEAKDVPHHRASVWYYAGGLTLLFFITQVVTGVLLMFYYEPSVSGAHRSVERIMTSVPFGWIVRSVHSWGANIVIALMLVHMFSAYFMKSYRMPRHLMWLTGIVLLLLMLGFGFTGYLLPWDETAYFATKIGTEVPREIPVIGEAISSLMKGSSDVSGATLTRMFALHVAILPLVSILLVLVHITMVALFGVSTPIGAKVTGHERYFPSYLSKEAIVWLIGFAVLIVIAVTYPWQLGKAYDLANPTEPPEGVHPEWYFMFMFQALRVVPEWIASGVFGLLLVFWTAVPFLDSHADKGRKSPVFTWIGIGMIGMLAALTTWAYISVGEEKIEAAENVIGSDSSVTAIIGVFLAATAIAALCIWLWRRSVITQYLRKNSSTGQ